MSRYISWTDVVGKYPDAARGGATAEMVNTYWIPGAEAEVDGRLSVRYTVPFAAMTGSTAPPDLIRDICIDLAYTRIVARQDSSNVIYERAQSLLTALVDGTMNLVGADVVENSSQIPNLGPYYSSAFGPDDPINWRPDYDKIVDAEDDRS